jgi:hypothetical protein
MADVTSPFGFPYPEDTDLVRDGAQDIENLAEGVNDYLTGGFLYAGTRYYTSSGTFAKADPFGTGDIGLRAIRVRVVGGGGAGGGAILTGAGQVAVGSGGQAGGYSESFITNIAGLSATATVTVGAGGSGVSAANGAAGGASSFDTTVVVAPGGQGGAGATSAGTPPALRRIAGSGSPGTGDIALTGDVGQPGIAATTGSVGGGTGGASVFGGNARSGFGAGDNATGIGGGGSGSGHAQNVAASTAGGLGFAGIVIVDCFV